MGVDLIVVHLRSEVRLQLVLLAQPLKYVLACLLLHALGCCVNRIPGLIAEGVHRLEVGLVVAQISSVVRQLLGLASAWEVVAGIGFDVWVVKEERLLRASCVE